MVFSSGLITKLLLLIGYINRIYSQCIIDGCGSFDSNRSCQCNTACENFNDCCNDYFDHCKSIDKFTECPNAPSIPQDRRTNKNELKIVSYNVEWLFLNQDHSSGTGVTCPGSCPWGTYNEALIHLNAIAGYLSTIDPDIVILSEVCDCWTVQELINQMVNSDQYRVYLVKGMDTFTGQQVAIMTKVDPVSDMIRTEHRHSFPITNSECQYTGNPGTTGVSKHFKQTFNIEGFDKPIDIIGIHLLSIPTGNPSNCARREAQALVLADLIKDSVNDDHYVIIAGDYNDYDDIVKDRNNNVPWSQVTKIIREAGNLINVANMIQDQPSIWTAWYDYYRNCRNNYGLDINQIDMIHVSNEIYNKITNVDIDHGYQNGCDNIYSDHYPVIMTLDPFKSSNVSPNQSNIKKSWAINDTILYIILPIISITIITSIAILIKYCIKKHKSQSNNISQPLEI